MIPTNHGLEPWRKRAPRSASTGPLALLWVAIAAVGCSPAPYVRLLDPLDGSSLLNGGGPGDGAAGTGGTGGDSTSTPPGSGGDGAAGGGVISTGGSTPGFGTGGLPPSPPEGSGGAAPTVGGSGGADGSGSGSGGAGGSGVVTVPGTGGRGSGGSGSGGNGSGGTVPGGSGGHLVAGTGGASSGGAPADTARYSFEQGTQSWGVPSGNQPAFAAVTSTTAAHFAGQSSLGGSISTGVAHVYQLAVQLTAGSPAAGAKVTFHVQVPVGAPIDWVQPYVKTGAPGYVWTGVTVAPPSLTPGAWNAIVVTVPSPSATIQEIGVQFDVTAAFTGTVYIDTVTW